MIRSGIVRLTPQQQEFIESQVAEGRYLSNSEVIREGLRLLQEDTEWRAELRRKITEGMLQAKAGKLVDGKQAIARALEGLDD
jgi:antitoxin ParD1/3/4